MHTRLCLLVTFNRGRSAAARRQRCGRGEEEGTGVSANRGIYGRQPPHSDGAQ